MTKEGYDLQKISFYKSGFTKNSLAFQINKAYVKLLQKKNSDILSLISTLNAFIFIKLESVSTLHM